MISPNGPTPTRRLPALLLIAGLFTLAACDSNSLDDSAFSTLEVQDLFNTVTAELALTDAQQNRLAATLSPHDRTDRTPGYLWIVADSLSQTLTDEQKAELLATTVSMERLNPFRGLGGFGGGYYGLGGFRGGSSHHGTSPLDPVLNLTEAQQAEIQALHEDFRSQLHALRETHAAGTLSDDDFLAEIQALHEAKEAALDALLTDEQKAALDAFRAEREATFEVFKAEVEAVRDAVLGLTPTESATFNAILSDQLDTREVLLEQFMDGTLSRNDLTAEIEALVAARNEALEALLTAAQYEVVQIHAALITRAGRQGHRGNRPGRFGGPGRG